MKPILINSFTSVMSWSSNVDNDSNVKCTTERRIEGKLQDDHTMADILNIQAANVIIIQDIINETYQVTKKLI